MNENQNKIEEIKNKIRERYKGIDQNRINIIPANPDIKDVNSDLQDKNVAVYARVSTDDTNQTTSYELQKNHYMDLINKHENWNLVDIYADEGISGTSLNHRDSFAKMIEDCRAGKINLIITKSVSRFARNTKDCLEYVRELRALPKPVGIFFETEGIYTLDNRYEFILTILASVAQEESHNKSDIMNASIDMRFRRGIFLTPPFLGYDVDDDGNLRINEEEAKTVKLIFYMYLAGSTCQQIADTLSSYGFQTKKGNTKWSAGSILYILQNERNCGDLLARKTWTPDFLNHKSKKNKNNRIQYSVCEHHDGIVSRDDFLAVQRLISNAKYGNKGFLPELKVIHEGALQGFVIIHPKWGSFAAKDYCNASNSVSVYTIEDAIEVKAYTGDFDLRKYEVARSQFFDTFHKVCVTFSIDNILFSTKCVRKLEKVLYIEMLIHPTKKILAVRQCKKDSKTSIQWAKVSRGLYYSKPISCSAFINTLYEIMEWNPKYKYRVRGLKRNRDNENLILFDMSETEVFISQNSQDGTSALDSIMPFTVGPKKDIMAFPNNWADTFGENYYRQAQAKELAILNAECDWNSSDEGITYSSETNLNVTSKENIQNEIDKITKNKEQETLSNG